MNLRRSLLAAPLAVCALAAPAQAASVTYDVTLSGTLSAKVAGADGAGWNAGFDLDAGLDQTVTGLTVTDDKYPVLKPAASNRFHDTSLSGDVTETTVDGTLSWTCKNEGQAQGPPGNVTMASAGDDAVEITVVAAQSVDVLRTCTGFSTGSVMSHFAPGPLKVTFTVPRAQLAAGAVAKPFSVPVPCGEVSIFQTSCEQDFTGVVTVIRTDTPSPEPEPQEPDIDELLAPLVKMVKEVTGKVAGNGKSAKVKVKCATACSGKVSATAVATAKQKAVALGTKTFSSPASGTKPVTIMFGKTGARAAAQRGAVIINVKSVSGQSTSTRLSVPR